MFYLELLCVLLPSSRKVWVEEVSSGCGLAEFNFPEVFFVIDNLLSLQPSVIDVKSFFVEWFRLTECIPVACTDLVSVKFRVRYPACSIQKEVVLHKAACLCLRSVGALHR